MAKKDFEKMLLEAIDEALSTLGTSARQSIYFHLETQFKIPKNEIPRRLDAFEEGLTKIFGPGSQFLAILIMKKLYEKIGRPLKWDESKKLTFAEYISAAKLTYAEAKNA